MFLRNTERDRNGAKLFLTIRPTASTPTPCQTVGRDLQRARTSHPAVPLAKEDAPSLDRLNVHQKGHRGIVPTDQLHIDWVDVTSDKPTKTRIFNDYFQGPSQRSKRYTRYTKTCLAWLARLAYRQLQHAKNIGKTALLKSVAIRPAPPCDGMS